LANTVTLQIKINDNGDLELLSSNAQKAAASTDKLAKSQEKAGTGAERHNKQQKGVAGATSNSTKAFSKMTTGITGGLVPAYAVLAANIFAITAAFGALRRAAAFEQLEQGLIRVGGAAGQNLPYVAQQLKDITGAAVSAEASMSATALAMSSGFSTEQLTNLTKVAKGASQALGRDMEDALNRLVRGTAKLEPEILDELGIMVRLDDAVEEYAKSIGKVGTDLTQFERRQAFLNATIEQGEKKFGDIAKNIDPNAYDQLAATFADLTKDVLTLVNKGLTPLVAFLSSSPIALKGVLLAFGSTLLSTILPAISSMSEGHKRSSIQAAIAAKKSSKVITKEYAQASQAAAKGLSLLPKSIQHLAPKIKAGTLNLKEQQKVLKTLKASEALRAAALSKGLESTRAQRALELQQIRDQIVLTEQLSVAEKTKFKSSEQGTTAKGKSTASGLTSRGLKEMEMAEGITKKFGVALKYSKLQMMSVGKVNGTLWTKIKVGATAARGAVTLFGTALLSAIPIIGQVLMVASLLWPVVEGMFGKGKMEKELEKITDSFKSFIDIGNQLKETLEGDITATEAFVATLRVQVGIMNQVIDAHKKYIDSLRADRLNTILEKTKELEDSANGGFFSSGWTWSGGFLGGFVEAKISADNLSTEITDLKENINQIDPVSIGLIGEAFVDSLKQSGPVTGALGKSLTAYQDLMAKVESGAIKTNAEFIKGLKDINRGAQSTLASIDVAKSAMGDFTKETITLGSKVNTPYDNLIDKSKAMAIEFKNAGKEGGLGFQAFKDNAKGLQAQLDHIRTSNFLPKWASDSTLLDRMNTQLEAVRDTILTSKAKVKELGIEQKKVNKISRDSPEALKESLRLSEEIRLEKGNLLQAELNGLKIIVKTEEQEERITQIKAEQSALAAEKVSIEERNLQVKVAQVTEDNKILALGDKLTQGAKAELEHELAMLRVAQQIKVAKTGKAIAPQEAFKNLKDETQIRQTMVALELSSKLTAINMEYALLDAQIALQKQRAIDAGVYNKDTYDTITSLMAAGKESAITGAINAATLADKQITADLATSERTSLDASRSTTGTMGERIQAAGGKGGGGALDPESTMATLGDKTAAAVNAMQPMMDLMGPEGALISSVAQGAVAITDAWSTAFKTMGDDGKISMGAAMEAASATLGALGGMLAQASADRIAGVDDEIAAEQKRDGQSAASVAKIKKLEAKKEAMKKKAFETDKKVKMAQTIMNTAAGIMHWNSEGNLPMAIATGIMGAIQLATIASTSYKGSGSSAPSGEMAAVSMGNRENTVDLARGNSASGELGYMRGEAGQGTGATNFKPSSAFTGAKYRASGGETAGFMVGEQGPEMFIPDRSGRIAPADETASMGTTSNVNFNISAVDAAGVEDVLVRQKGHIIRMIREAANEHGQPFLEDISDGSYTS
jgi:hypothetical protein